MTTKPEGRPIEPRWLTFAEAADYARVSKGRLFDWIKSGRLRAVRLTEQRAGPGTRGLVDRTIDKIDLDQFLCSLKESVPVEPPERKPRERREIPSSGDSVRARIRAARGK